MATELWGHFLAVTPPWHPAASGTTHTGTKETQGTTLAFGFPVLSNEPKNLRVFVFESLLGTFQVQVLSNKAKDSRV